MEETQPSNPHLKSIHLKINMRILFYLIPKILLVTDKSRQLTIIVRQSSNIKYGNIY